MKTLKRALLPLAMLMAAPLAAQDVPGGGVTPDTTTPTAPAMNPVPVVVGSPAAGRIGEFEPAKQSAEFNGLQLQLGGSFAQT